MTADNQVVPWYREGYVWLLISFPLAAVIGGIITIVLAIKSDDGLVVDDYYKKGLEINRTLERDRLAEEYGLAASLQYAKDDPDARLIISANNDFTFPGSLRISFLNASRAGMDQHHVLSRSGANTYILTNPKLSRGKWHLLIESEDWRLLDVLNIP